MPGPDELADFFGKSGFNETPTPKPQQKVDYPDLETGPQVDHPFRGNIPPEIQNSFLTHITDTFTNPKPLYFKPYKEYLMAIDMRMVTIDEASSEDGIQLGRHYYDKVAKGEENPAYELANKSGFKPSGTAYFNKGKNGFDLDSVIIPVEGDDGTDPFEQTISFSRFRDNVRERHEEGLEAENDDIEGKFPTERSEFTVEYRGDGSFRALKFEGYKDTGDFSYKGTLEKEEKAEFKSEAAIFKLSSDGTNLIVKRYVGEKLMDEITIPQKVSRQEMIDKLLPPQLQENPQYAHPEFDRIWMNSNLLDVMGIKWQANYERKTPRSPQEIKEYLEKNP